MNHANDDKKRPGSEKPHKTDANHKPTHDELDEALEESFPASDPASMTRTTTPGNPNDKPRKRG
jgi:hypothetical protein